MKDGVKCKSRRHQVRMPAYIVYHAAYLCSIHEDTRRRTQTSSLERKTPQLFPLQKKWKASASYSQRMEQPLRPTIVFVTASQYVSVYHLVSRSHTAQLPLMTSWLRTLTKIQVLHFPILAQAPVDRLATVTSFGHELLRPICLIKLLLRLNLERLIISRIDGTAH